MIDSNPLSLHSHILDDGRESLRRVGLFSSGPFDFSISCFILFSDLIFLLFVALQIVLCIHILFRV